ncbi:MAG TPA: CocE/NonD family hydrolase [Nevskiaceae bacterium]|nr:CocE/NonD family hydrolase [Nevskiaceae bacterium]
MSDIPDDFKARILNPGYVERIEMIPMRDGVKLKTYIYIPAGAKGAAILLMRTPYNASTLKAKIAGDRYLEAGYIRVMQDVRGKYGSEGEYVVTRPVRGALNASDADHPTDTWDTIDWLVQNLRESNGRVAIFGNSYVGFTSAMALLDPHPALRAAVPVGPLIDAWMGDDWFHYGAFRQMMLGFIHKQTAQRGEGVVTPSVTHDKYEEFLRAGSAADYIREHGLDRLPFAARLMAHPAYDAYWQAQALDKLLAARPSRVPTMWTQGLWDQEDMYGANHAWRALKAAGYEANNWLVLGPWNHVQAWRTAASLGPMQWHADTAHQFQQDILLPFLDEHLRGGPGANLARVTAYNTGEKRWERLDSWPRAGEGDTGLKPLFLHAGYGLSFDRPEQTGGSDSYISDPAKPVPFLPRPVVDPFAAFAAGSLGHAYEAWAQWLVQDQRFVDGRPDVLSYETPVLAEAVRVRGIPVAEIHALTSGTDADFVVKLIDVFPAKDPSAPEHGGYQLPIAMDIFRGRYRDSFEHASAIPANRPQRYRFELPGVNHVFKPGHRIMVQIQSSLFPLYDRNPQTFVPNIFEAKAPDYRKAEIAILRSQSQASAVLLPVVEK